MQLPKRTLSNRSNQTTVMFTKTWTRSILRTMSYPKEPSERPAKMSCIIHQCQDTILPDLENHHKALPTKTLKEQTPNPLIFWRIQGTTKLIQINLCIPLLLLVKGRPKEKYNTKELLEETNHKNLLIVLFESMRKTMEPTNL